MKTIFLATWSALLFFVGTSAAPINTAVPALEKRANGIYDSMDQLAAAISQSTSSITTAASGVTSGSSASAKAAAAATINKGLAAMTAQVQSVYAFVQNPPTPFDGNDSVVEAAVETIIEEVATTLQIIAQSPVYQSTSKATVDFLNSMSGLVKILVTNGVVNAAVGLVSKLMSGALAAAFQLLGNVV